MANRILIKTSNRTPVITEALNNSRKILLTGEFGYTYTTGDSAGGDRLFIGAGGNTSGRSRKVHVVGGKYFTDMMDHPRGQLHENSAIITDANKKINQLIVDNITVDGNSITTSSGNLTLNPTTGTIDASTSTISSVVDPSSAQDAATKNYVDTKDIVFVSGDVNADGLGNVQTGSSIQVKGSWNTNTKRTDISGNSVKVEINVDSDLLGLSRLTVDNVDINGNLITTTSGDLTLNSTGGTVIIGGNLQIDGTTTTVNSTNLTVDDKNITLASGALNATAADSAGIHVDGANADIFYDAPTDTWNFNKDIVAPNLDVTGGITVSGGITGTYNGFDSDFAAKSTDDLTEGSNLYFTNARARNALRHTYGTPGYDSSNGVITLAGNTDQLAEGSTNLYFTNLRARQAHSVTNGGELGTITYNSTTGVTNFALFNTDIRSLFSASGDLSYDSSSGAFSIDVETEYTKANFDSDLGLSNTDQLPEGDSNLYYTTARADSDFDIRLATKNTDNLSEGSTNLYFTDERVDDRVFDLLSAGEGIDLTYNDPSNILTVAIEQASSTNLGGAKFDSVDFLVTAGNVELATIDCGTY